MKLIVYKDIHSDTVSAVRSSGHEVFYIAGGDQEFSVNDVCKKANGEGYVLMTGDEKLAQMLFDANRIQSGLILVDVNEGSTIADAKVVIDALQKKGGLLPNHYSIISKKGVKSAPLAGA